MCTTTCGLDCAAPAPSAPAPAPPPAVNVEAPGDIAGWFALAAAAVAAATAAEVSFPISRILDIQASLEWVPYAPTPLNGAAAVVLVLVLVLVLDRILLAGDASVCCSMFCAPAPAPAPAPRAVVANAV